MPELPEVEVLRRGLETGLVGRRIEAVEVRRTDLREPVQRAALERRAVGQRVAGVRRRAKYLLVDLGSGDVLVIHLGMSGRLTLTAGEAPRESHEHVAFGLDDGSELRFRDPRRFGLVLVRSAARLGRDRRFAALGVEPLGPEFTAEHLAAAARGRRAPVKGFLLDGRTVAGVGNIYACEALFRAGVNPRRSVARIAARRWERIACAVVEVLSAAIRQGGTTLNDFADSGGRPGYFQIALSVYDREGEACERCGAPVRRIVQSGRSTFYCPRCQT